MSTTTAPASAIIHTPEGIEFVRLIARRKGALALELKGLNRSAGRRTAYSICKSEYGLKGTRQSVLAQMQAKVDAVLNVRRSASTSTSEHRDG